jgi:hypothetical protein
MIRAIRIKIEHLGFTRALLRIMHNSCDAKLMKRGINCAHPLSDTQRRKEWIGATVTNVFCFLSSLPLQLPRQCLAPTSHLSPLI